MKMKTLIATMLMLIAAASAYAQGWTQGTFGNGMPTNITVGTSDTVWTCTVNYAAIAFCNDATNTVYMCPGTNAVTVGKGIRMNSQGGFVTFDAGGKPAQKIFHFIGTPVGGNVSVMIGANP